MNLNTSALSAIIDNAILENWATVDKFFKAPARAVGIIEEEIRGIGLEFEIGQYDSLIASRFAVQKLQWRHLAEVINLMKKQDNISEDIYKKLISTASAIDAISLLVNDYPHDLFLTAKVTALKIRDLVWRLETSDYTALQNNLDKLDDLAGSLDMVEFPKTIGEVSLVVWAIHEAITSAHLTKSEHDFQTMCEMLAKKKNVSPLRERLTQSFGAGSHKRMDRLYMEMRKEGETKHLQKVSTQDAMGISRGAGDVEKLNKRFPEAPDMDVESHETIPEGQLETSGIPDDVKKELKEKIAEIMQETEGDQEG